MTFGEKKQECSSNNVGPARVTDHKLFLKRDVTQQLYCNKVPCNL